MKNYILNLIVLLEKGGYISRNDRDIYIYSLKILFSYLVNITISIIICLSFGVMGYGMVFFVSFAFLRQNAGGYHAPNWIVCQIISCMVLVCTMLRIKFWITDRMYMQYIIVLAAYIIIMLWAPLEVENRILSSSERKKVRRKARRIVTLELIVGGVMTVIDKRVTCAVWSAIIWSGIGYLAWLGQKIKQRKKNEKC